MPPPLVCFNTFIMLKHKKPKSQTPSRILSSFIDKLSYINNQPVIDVACGYGRNGALFVNTGRYCIFCDIDDDALNFINNCENVADNGNINKELFETQKVDLISDWPFNQNSASGIINVHFYNENLIKKFIDTLSPHGFLYIETISARGENYLELPEYKSIYNTLSDKFDFLFYQEKKVKPFEFNKSTLTLLAIKK